MFSKQRRQVALTGAGDFERDVGQRQFIVRQESHGLSEAAPDDVLVQRYPRGRLEPATEDERIHADVPGDLVPFQLRVEVIVDEPQSASQHVMRQLRVTLRHFPVSLIRLPEASQDRLRQLFVTVCPIALRGALHEIDAHHSQSVLDFAQRHREGGALRASLLSNLKSMDSNERLSCIDAMARKRFTLAIGAAITSIRHASAQLR